MFIVNKIVFVLNIIAAALLLGSYLSPVISPQTFWPVSFLGLAYIPLLIANVVFVVYWLIQAKLHVFISVGAIVLGFSYIGRYYQISGNTKPADEKTIKVVSFNIQNFDERKRQANPYPEYFTAIGEEKPDIVCMQEFNRWVGINEKNTSLEELKLAMGKGFNYIERDKVTNSLIIASKHKIIRHKGFTFGKKRTTNGAMWADILIGKDTIRVFNVHFQSFLLNKVKLDSLDTKDKALEGSKSIVRRLRNGFVNRVPQVDSVLMEIENSPYKIILCGDFNDTPLSYTYGKMTKNLRDAFIECGSGLGATYSGPYPSFRIDYILHNPSFKAYNYKRGLSYGSDHKMIQVELALK